MNQTLLEEMKLEEKLQKGATRRDFLRSFGGYMIALGSLPILKSSRASASQQATLEGTITSASDFNSPLQEQFIVFARQHPQDVNKYLLHVGITDANGRYTIIPQLSFEITACPKSITPGAQIIPGQHYVSTREFISDPGARRVFMNYLERNGINVRSQSLEPPLGDATSDNSYRYYGNVNLQQGINVISPQMIKVETDQHNIDPITGRKLDKLTYMVFMNLGPSEEYLSIVPPDRREDKRITTLMGRWRDEDIPIKVYLNARDAPHPNSTIAARDAFEEWERKTGMRLFTFVDSIPEIGVRLVYRVNDGYKVTVDDGGYNSDGLPLYKKMSIIIPLHPRQEVFYTRDTTIIHEVGHVLGLISMENYFDLAGTSVMNAGAGSGVDDLSASVVRDMYNLRNNYSSRQYTDFGLHHLPGSFPTLLDIVANHFSNLSACAN